MLMPSIFGENLFDDLFDDFARPMNVIHYATPTPRDRKSTRLNSSHRSQSRMPSSA